MIRPLVIVGHVLGHAEQAAGAGVMIVGAPALLLLGEAAALHFV